jgi:hypothetical protein
MSYWSIPNAFGALFIVIILYFLLVKNKSSSTLAVALPVLLVMVVIILTHVIVALCMAMLLFIAWGVPVLYRKFCAPTPDYIPLLIPIGFTFAMIVWWNYLTDNLNNLASFIVYGFSLPRLDYTQLVPVSSPDMIIQLILSSLGQNIFLAISLIGLLYMLSRKGNLPTFSMALISFTPLVFVFITYLLSTEINGYRWLYISEILLSIPLALGLYMIAGVTIRRSSFRHLGFLFVIGTLSFLMLMGANGNDDNHFLIPDSDLVSSEYYTQAELTGSSFFAHAATGAIISDEDYAYNPSSSIFENVYGIPPERLGNLDSVKTTDRSIQKNSLIIFRNRYILGLQNKRVPSQLNLFSSISQSRYDKIYENPALAGYRGNAA